VLSSHYGDVLQTLTAEGDNAHTIQLSCTCPSCLRQAHTASQRACSWSCHVCAAVRCQQEEKAIAEGVMIRDAWDGSIQDIELEVTGFQRQQFTEEQERAAVESAVSSRRRLSMR
jgi:hypothetical protein